MKTLFAPLVKDFYKVGHINQYPKGTTKIYSNFTARSGKHSNIPDSEGVLFVGLQPFLQSWLIEAWNSTFFDVPFNEAMMVYKGIVDTALGTDFNISHMAALHKLGYLPIEIRALPEGSFVPYKVPLFTVENTHPDFYWVTNMLETLISAEMWGIITSATTYFAYRKNFYKYAIKTGAPVEFIPFQGHDFSYRGMMGAEAGAMSALGALLAGGIGTDTIPAILLAMEYYEDVDAFIGGSVPATEHSVMCAGGNETEFETYKRLLTEVYPSGIVSIVSDTWDFWSVITDFLPRLKDDIMAREGKLVIRPDSGDPVKILTGDDNAPNGTPEYEGLISLLWKIFGGTTTKEGYNILDDHIGAIYGDSITIQRQVQILDRLEKKGFASCNVVLGLGSYTYQYVTRDSHGFAMKATYAEINGKGIELFKDPKTDDGIKKSAKGLLMVEAYDDGRYFKLRDQVSPLAAKKGALEPVFKDGKILKKYSLTEVRDRVSRYLS